MIWSSHRNGTDENFYYGRNGVRRIALYQRTYGGLVHWMSHGCDATETKIILTECLAHSVSHDGGSYENYNR